MIGIYKITSPNNRIYIGQSVNVKSRFSKYKSLDCKSQTKLYKSFLKYGIINHSFEVLEECLLESLNDKERYWQDFFNSGSREHLNCRYTASNDKSGFMTYESKLKMSKSRTGIKRPISLIEKLKQINTGSKRSEESKLKMSLAQVGKKASLETRQKMSLFQKNKKVSLDTKQKMKENNKMSKKIIDLDTNIIYNSLSEYCELNNLNYKTTWGRLKRKTLKIKYYGNENL
jgi:group I intron endonuclease